MGDSELLHKMIVDFMKEQNAFNLQIIERLSKAEVRIYLVMTIISSVVTGLVNYFFQ